MKGLQFFWFSAKVAPSFKQTHALPTTKHTTLPHCPETVFLAKPSISAYILLQEKIPPRHNNLRAGGLTKQSQKFHPFLQIPHFACRDLH
jgi:hypothetical protein